MDAIDQKLAKITARLKAARDERESRSVGSHELPWSGSRRTQEPAIYVERLPSERLLCPACEAREERSAIMEHCGEVPRGTADRLAREAWPCSHAT
jgi:hypothetical protein